MNTDTGRIRYLTEADLREAQQRGENLVMIDETLRLIGGEYKYQPIDLVPIASRL